MYYDDMDDFVYEDQQKKRYKKSKQYEEKDRSGKTGHFALIGLIIGVGSLICSAISVAGFTNSAYKKSGEYYTNTSIFTSTTYNYRVYDPSVEQIPDLAKHESIDKVFEYYLSDVDLGGTQPFTAKAIYSKNIDALDITSYSKTRLISGEYTTKNNSLFIDKRLATKGNLDLGSSIVLNVKGTALDFKVSGIFVDNVFYDEPTCFFELTDSIKSQLEVKKPLKLKGAMIKAKNTTECLAYLQDYKPYGKLMSRENFGSQKEYNDYLERFNQDDYSGEIYNKNTDYQMVVSRDDIKKLESDAERLVKVGVIITSILVVLMSLSTILTKKYINNLQARQITVTTGKLIVGYTIITLIGLAVFLISSSIFLFGVLDLPVTAAAFATHANSYVYLTSISYLGLLLINIIALSLMNRRGI